MVARASCRASPYYLESRQFAADRLTRAYDAARTACRPKASGLLISAPGSNAAV